MKNNHSTPSFHKAILEAGAKLPELTVAEVFAKRMEKAGVPSPELAARALARHFLAGRDFTEFHWEGADEIEITFDENDLEEIENRFEGKLAKFPNLLEKLIHDVSSHLLADLKNDWLARRRLEDRGLQAFRLRLEDRWGDPLDGLRALHHFSLAEGENFSARLSRSKAKYGKVKKQVISKLHIRASQTVAEIITLLEHGFADGAFARWRTLHDIVTVAYFIEDGDDELAQRYLDHEHVDAKRALDTYVSVNAELECEPVSVDDAADINKKFQTVRQKYGQDFVSPFGWASDYLKNKSPRFSDIEKAAGRAKLRFHYKMASYNVHASARALSFRIGVLDRSVGPIAGASNAGIEEPGQNTVIALAQITLLVSERHKLIDKAVIHKVLLNLMDETAEAFLDVARQLQYEEDCIAECLEDVDTQPSVDFGI